MFAEMEKERGFQMIRIEADVAELIWALDEIDKSSSELRLCPKCRKYHTVLPVCSECLKKERERGREKHA